MSNACNCYESRLEMRGRYLWCIYKWERRLIIPFAMDKPAKSPPVSTFSCYIVKMNLKFTSHAIHLMILLKYPPKTESMRSVIEMWVSRKRYESITTYPRSIHTNKSIHSILASHSDFLLPISFLPSPHVGHVQLTHSCNTHYKTQNLHLLYLSHVKN